MSGCARSTRTNAFSRLPVDELLRARTSEDRHAFNEHIEAVQLRAHHWNTLGPALIIDAASPTTAASTFGCGSSRSAWRHTSALVDPEWVADLPADDPLPRGALPRLWERFAATDGA